MNALRWATTHYYLSIINYRQTYFPITMLMSNDFLQTATGQSKNKNKLHQLPIEYLEYRNSKSDRPQFLDVNIFASILFIKLKLWGFICTVLFYLPAKFWANRKYSQTFCQKAFKGNMHCVSSMMIQQNSTCISTNSIIRYSYICLASSRVQLSLDCNAAIPICNALVNNYQNLKNDFKT